MPVTAAPTARPAVEATVTVLLPAVVTALARITFTGAVPFRSPLTIMLAIPFSLVGILIHGYALFAMFKGFRACGERAAYLKEKGLPA